MREQQVLLLKKSFEKILAIREQVTELFYDHLFLANPGLRSMFRNNMADQGEKLITTLEYVISHFKLLPNGDYQLEHSLKKSLMNLGNDHKVVYGVKSAHYNKLEDSLLWTLELALGSDFTVEVRQSWREAYSEIVKYMIEGANAETSS